MHALATISSTCGELHCETVSQSRLLSLEVAFVMYFLKTKRKVHNTGSSQDTLKRHSDTTLNKHSETTLNKHFGIHNISLCIHGESFQQMLMAKLSVHMKMNEITITSHYLMNYGSKN